MSRDESKIASLGPKHTPSSSSGRKRSINHQHHSRLANRHTTMKLMVAKFTPRTALMRLALGHMALDSLAKLIQALFFICSDSTVETRGPALELLTKNI